MMASVGTTVLPWRRTDRVDASRPRSPWQYLRRVVVGGLACVLLVACGGGTPSAAPATPEPVTATPVATAKPVPTPTLAPTAAAAAHIQASVTDLLNRSDPQLIYSWIDAEASWLKGQPTLPVLADYRSEVEAQLVLLNITPTQAAVDRAVLLIADAARAFPGVTL